MSDDKKCCKAVCSAYKALRSQLTLERDMHKYEPTKVTNAAIGLLDEMVEDFCEGV